MSKIRSASGVAFELLWAGILLLGAGLLTGCATGTDSDTPGDGSTDDVTLTFILATTSRADGAHALAALEPSDPAFMIGSFSGWNPNDAAQGMYDDGTHGDNTAGDGLFTRQIKLPFEGDGANGPQTWEAGSTGFTYLFEVASSSASSASVNSMMDVRKLEAPGDCTNLPHTTAPYGLFHSDTLEIPVVTSPAPSPSRVVPVLRSLAQLHNPATVKSIQPASF